MQDIRYTYIYARIISAQQKYGTGKNVYYNSIEKAMPNNTKSNGLFNTQFATSCISTSLVLILLGTIVLFVLTAKNLSDYMRENINVSLLLNESMSDKDIDAFKQEISEKPYVKEIEYISKEQALNEECKAMGTDPTEFLGYNPFTASIEVRLNAQYANSDSLNKINNELRSNSNVVDVIYQKELMDSVNRNIRKVSIILLIIAVLFTYISFALINNTVRLTIFSQRFLINTMKLVGASWWFIRKPFLKRSAILGIMSVITANALLYVGLQALKNYEPQITSIITDEVLYIVGGTVLVFGMLITFTCTYFSLSRYLRMNSNELYHI